MGVLHEFYVAYDAWIKAGAIGPEFSRELGLCVNLYDFAEVAGFDPKAASCELHNAFEAAEYDSPTPFNRPGYSYAWECFHAECHLNEQQLAWVAEQLRSN